MQLPWMTIKGWVITVAVVTGALSIVMTSVSFHIDRTPDGSSTSWTLDLSYLIAWAVVVISILVLLKFWKFPTNP